MGIVPEALFNFLTLLGWSPGENREIFTRDEAAQWFDLRDVNKAPAVFDPEKLIWMNGQYLMRMTRRADLSAPRPVSRRRSAAARRAAHDHRSAQDARANAARDRRADADLLRR